jgi:hypothetical protein
VNSNRLRLKGKQLFCGLSALGSGRASINEFLGSIGWLDYFGGRIMAEPKLARSVGVAF